MAAPGDAIQIAPGRYTGAGNRNMNVSVSGISIAGAGRDATIIDLERLGLGFALGSFSGAATIEKLTVINGDCDAAPAGRDKNGAAFYFWRSSATIRDVAVRRSYCKSAGVEYMQWSGAAFYLKDSTVTIYNAEVTDCEASHGAAVAAWGLDQSKFYGGLFERLIGTQWGGAVLAEDNSTTEYHGMLFRHSYSSYGAVMDDGGHASPLFSGCIFEYNDGRYGSVGYHYADSSTRWVDCIFRHNIAVSAAIYINANTKPLLRNCSFINNTCTEETAALRSTYNGGRGRLIFERLSFINNTAASFNGAVSLKNHPNSVELRDCYFEGNRALGGHSGALNLYVIAREPNTNIPHGDTFVRLRFVRNGASSGGAVVLQDMAPEQRLGFRDCTFEENYAEQFGAAVSITGAGNTTFASTTFRANKAGTVGGAVAIKNEDQSAKGQLYFVGSAFQGNSAISAGGAFSCAQGIGSSTHTWFTDSTFDENSAIALGGAVIYKCGYLTISGGRFKANNASGGSGGAIALGAQTLCADGTNKTRFADVAFQNNEASVGGGLVFFDHVAPKCRLPILPDGSFNTSDETWSWQDPATLVKGNIASYGQLHATAPAKINTQCVAANESSGWSALAGCRTIQNGTSIATIFDTAFVGMEVELVSTMTDDFGQKIAGENAGVGVQIATTLKNVSAPFATVGLGRFWFDAGQVAIAGLRITSQASSADILNSTQYLQLAVPSVLVEYSYLPPAEVKLIFGLCPAGWVRDDKSSRVCTACPGGYFALTGAEACDLCAAGTYSPRQGSAACLRCPPGHKCPEGTVEPIACQFGQFQSDTGSSECQRCPIGQYQNGTQSTACMACRDDRKTAGLGAVMEGECACAEAFFSRSPADRCEPCPAGMLCGFDSDLSNFLAVAADLANPSSTYPKLLPGFYSSEADPVNVFKCKNAVACPGGDPGTCSSNRGESAGFLCEQCGDQQYMEEGVCLDCQWHQILVIVIVFLVVMVCLVYLARASALVLTAENPQMTTMVMVLGQMLTFLQVSAAIGKLPISWTTPFLHFIDLLSYLSLGVGALKLECLSLGSDYQTFAFQVFLPLVLVGLLLVFYLIARIIRPLLITADGMTNAIGQLAVTLYITFTLTALVPFHCYGHPNGESSVVQYPQVRCHAGGAHSGMLAAGIIGVLIYPCFTICLVLFAVKQYPKKIVSADLHFVQRFRFVFFRWAPDRYWFGAVMIIRNLLIPLFPMTIPQDSSDVTAMLMLLVLLLVLLTAVMVMPWRNKDLNYTDICMNFIMTFTLAIGCMALTGSKTLSQPLNTALFVISMLAIALGLAVALHQLVKSLRKEPQYAVFLSHHKGAGACAARLLKYMLQKELRKPIFYDCDDLVSFSGIFTAVKQSNCLLVMLSGETLCRPWCAGEIVTAHHCKIRMLPMRLCDDGEVWTRMSSIEQDQLVQDQFQVLRPHGINLDHIHPAFDALLQKAPMELPLIRGSRDLWKAVRAIAAATMTGEALNNAGAVASTNSGVAGMTGSCDSRKSGSVTGTTVGKVPSLCIMNGLMSLGAGKADVSSSKTLIMCDGQSSEAAAAAHFIRQMLQERLQVQIDTDMDMNAEAFEAAIRLDTILSVLFVAHPVATMRSGLQLSRLAMLYKIRPQAQTLAVVVGDSFVFPDQEWFAALEAGANKDISANLLLYLPDEITSSDVAAGVRRIFRGIAKFINVAYASRTVLDASMNTLAGCVKDSWRVTAAAQLENGYAQELSPPSGCPRPSGASDGGGFVSDEDEEDFAI